MVAVLTAEDVRYSVERVLTAPGGPNATLPRSVDKVEVLDRYTVKLTLYDLRRSETMGVLAPKVHSQLVSVLRAGGMSDQHAATTAELMVETDLCGVDSHGISMLPTYAREFRSGRLNMRPVFKSRSDPREA